MRRRRPGRRPAREDDLSRATDPELNARWIADPDWVWPIGALTALWRYPAKSMIGESIVSTTVSDLGVVGDRGWALRDETNGSIRGAKKIPELMGCSARYLSEPTIEATSPPIEIVLPDASTVRSSDADVDARLSAAVGRPVTLWPLQPKENLDHYRRGAPDSDDLMVELRDIFGRLDDEPLPDFGLFPPELIEFESPPGTYMDAYPVHIMTTGTLRTLGDLLADSAIDVRRFRPNLVIDTDATSSADNEPGGWPEMSWVGRQLRVGTCELRIVAPCPRCVMITRPVGELPGDSSILRTVVAAADQHLGVYATVLRSGTVSVGDAAHLVD